MNGFLKRFSIGRKLFFIAVMLTWSAHLLAEWSSLPYFVMTAPLVFLTLLAPVLQLFAQFVRPTVSRNLLHMATTGAFALTSLGIVGSSLPNYVKDFGIRKRVQAVSDEAKCKHGQSEF